MLKLSIYLLLFISYFQIVGQSKFAHYTTTEGLPNNLCYGIVQDSKGYIWIGTDDGLSKFNGTGFTNFRTDQGFETNFVITPIQHQGAIIASTWGKGLYKQSDTQFQRLTLNDSISKINNLTSANGALWSSSVSRNYQFYENTTGTYNRKLFQAELENGLLKFSEGVKPNQVSVSFRAIKDSLYVFDSHRVNYEKFSGIYTTNQSLETRIVFPFLKDYRISSLSSNEDSFYAGSQSNIIVFNKYEILKVVQLKDFKNNILKIAIYGDKFIVASGKTEIADTVSLYDFKGNLVQNITKALGIKTNISDLILDHENNVWISSYGQGIYCLYASEKYKYSEFKETQNMLIKDISGIGNTTYILSDENLLQYESNKLQEKITINGSPNSVTIFNNKIRLSILGKSFSEKTSGKNIDFQSESLAYNDNSELYYIKEDLIFLPDNKTIQDKRLLSLLLNDMIVFDGNVFIATNTGLFFKKHNSLQSHQEIKVQVHKLFNYNNSLLLATSDGLYSMNSNREMILYENTKGLEINAVFVDNRDQIWLGTKDGISIINEKKLQTLYLKNSIGSSYITSFFEDVNKQVLFGTNNGAYTIDNNSLIELQEAPLVNIEQNEYSFSIDVITYNRSNAKVLAYRINKKEWVDTKETTLDFSNFDQGDYTIDFRAKKIDGEWFYSDSYSFKLKNPWYQQPLFYLVITILMALTIIFFISIRLKKIRKRNSILNAVIKSKAKLETELAQVRNNMAKDFHDQMGNKLARITMVSDHILSEQKEDLNDFTAKSLQTVKTDAEDLYQGTRDFMFSLKSDSDYFIEVVDYIIDFSRDYLISYAIDCEIEKNISGNPRLPYYSNRQVILIFKEAITNISKHANASQVDLTFTNNNKLISLSCKDNGIGIEKTLFNSSRGIANMKERAISIGFNLKIDTSSQGTTILLSKSI